MCACTITYWKRVWQLLLHSFSVAGAEGVSEGSKGGTMDKSKFDDLARALAQGTSRRDVLRGALFGVTAGAAITVLPNAVAAQDDMDDETSDNTDDETSDGLDGTGGGTAAVETQPAAAVPAAQPATLPATGIGGSNTENGWIAAVAAGGAVAAAATVLRRNRAESDDSSIS